MSIILFLRSPTSTISNNAGLLLLLNSAVTGTPERLLLVDGSSLLDLVDGSSHLTIETLGPIGTPTALDGTLTLITDITGDLTSTAITTTDLAGTFALITAFTGDLTSTILTPTALDGTIALTTTTTGKLNNRVRFLPEAGTISTNGTIPLLGSQILFASRTGDQITISGHGWLKASPTLWWDLIYFYRHRLSITGPPTGLPAGHPVKVSIPVIGFFNQGKVRSDFEDIEVLYFSPTLQTWIVVGRSVVQSDNFINIEFELYDAIPGGIVSDDYYVYYGNKELKGQPTRPIYVSIDWPIQIPNTDAIITYTRPTESWRNGTSNIHNAQATMEFYGSSIRVIADKDIDKGIAEVQIDNGNWVTIDLFSPTLESNAEVYSTDGLGLGLHKIRFRSTGRKNPTAVDKIIDLVEIDYVKSYVVDIFNEEVHPQSWTTIVGGQR